MKHTKYWPYLKWSAMIFWGLFILFIVIINLTGCSKEIPVCKNITITNTVIEYINTTIKEPCNLTSPKERELELIRRIKYLENQQDKWIINETECIAHNKTEEDLEKCWNKLDFCEDDIDDLEDEINDCEKINCKYNSSLC